MDKRLSCQQVLVLLNFYMEELLNPAMKIYVEQHLKNCPNCRQKAEKLKTTLKKITLPNSDKKTKEDTDNYDTIKRLSAYMDNELNNNENIRIKKMTISNSKVRKELETLYKFQKAIHSAYEKTKNDSKFDYSKNILTKLQDGYDYSTGYFYKIATVFVMLLLGIIAGFLYLNW